MISGSARAQSGASTFKNEVSGGYLYGDSLAPYEAYGGSSGYSLGYSYRLLHWLALEAGFQHLLHAPDTVYCCAQATGHVYYEYAGARFVWEPKILNRLRLSAGGGYGHSFYHPPYVLRFGQRPDQLHSLPESVAAVDYALTRSGRWRAGVQARFYVAINRNNGAGTSVSGYYTLSPQLTFAFH